MSDILATWERLMQAVEKPYAAAVTEEKNRFIVEVSSTFAYARRIVDEQSSRHAALMMGIARKYQGIGIRLALHQALKGPTEKARVYQRKEDWDKLWLYLVHEWVQRWGAARAREAAGTTQKDIQTIIDRALASDVEFNPVQVATDILTARDLSQPRADVIARTEVHAAMMYASHEGARVVSNDAGITLKKSWVPVLDERTRISHAVMANVDPIPLDADFDVGGERMARPGDPRGSAGNVIGCRCVLAYSVEGAG